MHTAAADVVPNAPTRVSLVIRPHALAPRRVRRAVVQLCDGVGVPKRVSADAAFVSGELVTNSIKQTGRPSVFAVELVADGIRVQVRDSGSGAPQGEDCSPGTTRSWDVVRRLSTSFGFSCADGQREMWALLRSSRAFSAAVPTR